MEECAELWYQFTYFLTIDRLTAPEVRSSSSVRFD